MLKAHHAPRRPAGRQVRVPPVSVSERVDGGHTLVWQVHGGSSVRLEGEIHVLAVDEALWIPAGVRHSCAVDADSVLLSLSFCAGRLPVPYAGRHAVVLVDETFRLLLLALQQSRTGIARPDADVEQQVLDALAESLTSDRLPMPSVQPAMAVARDLSNNPADGRSVDELARSAHASARTLQRTFLAETGMTLREWRMRNRMRAAASLLRSDIAVEAVAHRVGYSDAAFRRVFKQYTGMPPSRFAERYRRRRF